MCVCVVCVCVWNKPCVIRDVLYPVWRNLNISKEVRIRIFNTNVKSELIYACETWKTSNRIKRRLQIYVNKCLKRIMNVKWTDKITNEKLWRITHQKLIENEKKKKEENGIGFDWTHIT